MFEATRACAHDCEFCVAPTAWGRKQFQKPVDHVVEDIRRVGAQRILFIDLNLISDRAYARELFTALIPLNVRWFGLSTSLIGRDPRPDGADGAQRLRRPADRTRDDLRRAGLRRRSASASTIPRSTRRWSRDLHALGIGIQGCFVFGLDHDTPGRLRRDRASSPSTPASTCRASRC